MNWNWKVKLLLWPMCVAVALCLEAVGIARYGGEVNSRAEWAIILSAGTIMWILVLKAINLYLDEKNRNRYRWRKRLDLWRERQFPILPFV